MFPVIMLKLWEWLLQRAIILQLFARTFEELADQVDIAQSIIHTANVTGDYDTYGASVPKKCAHVHSDTVMLVNLRLMQLS